MFRVYLFYFRALLSLSCWPCRGVGTTASNNIFFGCKFDPKKLLQPIQVERLTEVFVPFVVGVPTWCF
jgi:hypothetical protein